MLKTSRPAIEVIEHFKKNNVQIARLFPSMDTYVRALLRHAPRNERILARLGSNVCRINGYELSHKCLPRGRSFSSDKENRQNGALAPEELWYF